METVFPDTIHIGDVSINCTLRNGNFFSKDIKKGDMLY